MRTRFPFALIWADFAAAAMCRDNTITVTDAAAMADNMAKEFDKRFVLDNGRWEERFDVGPNQQPRTRS